MVFAGAGPSQNRKLLEIWLTPTSEPPPPGRRRRVGWVPHLPVPDTDTVRAGDAQMRVRMRMRMRMYHPLVETRGVSVSIQLLFAVYRISAKTGALNSTAGPPVKF